MLVAHLALLAILGWITAAQEDRCKDRSCYPITGNLLIGRQERITSDSTCGLNGRERWVTLLQVDDIVPFRFCIVSHLEEQTKCFYCDSRLPWNKYRPDARLSHRIDNVITNINEEKNVKWYQSENGKQHVVVSTFITFDSVKVITLRSYCEIDFVKLKFSDYLRPGGGVPLHPLDHDIQIFPSRGHVHRTVR